MQTLFWFIPEALNNTTKIAEMIDIKIKTWWILIPKYELPENDAKIYKEILKLEKDTKWIQKLDSSQWYLRYISFLGMNTRFDCNFSQKEIFEFIKKLDKPWLNKKLQETSPEELKELSLIYYTDKKKQFLNTLDKKIQDYIERLEYELVVIHEMWFEWYFLIVADYISWARGNNIPVWPGRWSVAGSLMAYLTQITDLNPLSYNLLFERFLNPARVSMPDIDIDFADNERDLVVDYCRWKYWSDYVAQICTFGTFAARAAVKDVWRVMWVSFAEMNKLVKLIPEKAGTKLKNALEESLEFKEAYESNKLYKKIIDNALKIEWNVRQLWVHACAVIIAPKPIINFTALTHPPKDDTTIVTQYSAYPLEDLWLLKMDFLWLKNLTIIKKTGEIVEKNSKTKPDMLNLDMEDKKVFKIFSSWNTTWIFQFESDGMRKYLRDLKPNTFEDIIVMVSLYRPWPIQYIPTYINRKHKKEKVEYEHPSLEKILSPTQWIAVYQEQIMQMVQTFAWFSLWEADILRRAIWKKKIKLLMEQKKKFIKASQKEWHDEKLALHIFEDVIEPFAGYWFNKSHAACYAFIAYQTAFLKAYYPTEFLTAIMISDEENMDKIVVEVNECKNKWIFILPPSVNHSLKHFRYIDKKNIRFWLKAIKWIWEGPINKIKEARKSIWWTFKNIEQFIEICWKEVTNKKSLEALIMSWAMDELWKRKVLFEAIASMIMFCKKDEKKKETNQMWLFDNHSEFKDKLMLKDIEDFSFEEKLAWEKEMIGFYISGHPLDWLKRYCSRRSTNVRKIKMSIDELQENSNLTSNGEKRNNTRLDRVQAVWIITNIRKIITKTQKIMMFLKCEWFNYDFEVVVFPKDVEKYLKKLIESRIIIVNWNLNINLKYNSKSIQSKDIKVATISQVRNQARELWLFDDSKRIFIEDFISKSSIETPIKSEDKVWDRFIINVPNNAKKEDLHSLKSFIQKEKVWDIKIYLNFKWQEIDTKIAIFEIKKLKEFISDIWRI
jgi:DNA polymerase III subunit alpha